MTERAKMCGNKLFDMLHQDAKDGLAKHLHRTVPLLDDRPDEGLLHYEWVATRKFSCAGSTE